MRCSSSISNCPARRAQQHAGSKSACTSSGVSRRTFPASSGPASASSTSTRRIASRSAPGSTRRKTRCREACAGPRAPDNLRHNSGPAPRECQAMSDLLARLYPDHLATLQQRADAALARGGFDRLVVAAGVPAHEFLDDRPYPFAVNPHFKHWLPVTKAPGSWLVHTPGKKPTLIYLQPHDYWHVVPDAPAGYWVEHFDIVTIREPQQARAHLPAAGARCAIIGESNATVGDFAPNNPAVVLNHLHYHRAYKTDYELAMMRVASKLGARAHRAAEATFRSGGSEYAIHMAYLGAVHETENELPYSNIIALNQHGAVLHYTDLNRAPPAHAHSFLIDAGASFHGYASDITRTYAADDAPEFRALVDAVDAAQRGFVDKVRPGQAYPELHIH